MIGIIFCALLIIFLVGAFPTLLTRRIKPLTWWNYLYPFTGIVAWNFLAAIGVGSLVSLSNFAVEQFWVFVASLLSPWIYWGLIWSRKRVASHMALFVTFLPILVAAMLRYLMPTLPV